MIWSYNFVNFMRKNEVQNLNFKFANIIQILNLTIQFWGISFRF